MGRYQAKTENQSLQGGNNMKRKIMAVTLTAAMLAGLTAVPAWAEDAAADEGKVLNIYCWNEEFKSRLTDHYPGYEEVDGTHGKIGDVDVVWNITPSDIQKTENSFTKTNKFSFFTFHN